MRFVRIGRQLGLAGCLFVLLALTLPASGQEYLPAWFLTPPQGLSVALFASSEGAAKSDGARILATYTRSIVWGDFQSLYDSSIDSEAWLNTEYYYYVDPERVAKLEPQMAILDSAVASIFPRMNFYLVGQDGSAQINKENILTASLACPDWASSTGFERDGAIFGVGRCATSGSIAAGWIKAEENAVFELLMFQGTKIGTITKATSIGSSASLAKIEWITLKYKLEGLRVIERWIDLENSLCMVLVSAPGDGIRRINE